jgi:effector-binding domain-containing protein
MLDTPRIVQTTAQQTAVVRLTVPRSEIQQVMGPAIGEVMQTLAAQGIAPTGPVFSHHFKMDPLAFDFEVGVPVAAPVSPAGRVRPGTLPAVTVARTIHRGAYEGLGDAWGAFGRWIAAHGHTPTADLWECYLTGPESGADPSTWRTELNRPLHKVAEE